MGRNTRCARLLNIACRKRRTLIESMMDKTRLKNAVSEQLDKICDASALTPDHRGSLGRLAHFACIYRIDEFVQDVITVHLFKDCHDGVHAMQVEPDGALAIHVCTNTRVIAVSDGLPLLLGAHLRDLRHCGDEA